MTTATKQPKIAERLSILNRRQLGVLTRLYFMKTNLADSDTRHPFLPGGDKSFDSAWKVLLKKFPSLDSRSNSILSIFCNQKEIFKQTSLLYYNFVDVLEVQDNVLDLLQRISNAGIRLEITLNSDLTYLYLELTTNYFAMMYFLTRIPDLKAVLVLFNFLFEQANGKPEPNFSRMAERFTEPPEVLLKHLLEEFKPYAPVLSLALGSLNDFFIRRTVRAQNWRDSLFLNILAEPRKITHTALSDQLACELLSYEVMERWVVFGFLLVGPSSVGDGDDAFSRIRLALRNSYVVVLFRDEVIHVHSLLITFFESVWTGKSSSKRLSDIKEAMSIAYSQAPGAHSDRRAYLRSSLRQLHSVLSDQPGLLGPKAFIVFWGLSYAADEIHWLLRHFNNMQPKRNINVEEFADVALPELLYYIEDLRHLVRRYTAVIQRFHIQMLPSYDAPGLEEYLRPSINYLPMEEVDIFNGMLTQLREVEDLLTSSSPRHCEFTSLRLDWLRLQAILSSKDSPLPLANCRRLAEHLHSTTFHTRLIDQVEDLLRQVSDLSVYYFYWNKLEEVFNHSLAYPSQLRYSGVFLSLPSSFVNICHEMCPKERFIVGRTAGNLTRRFCRKLVDALCTAFFTRLEEACTFAEQLAPQKSVPWLIEEKLLKKKAADTNGTIKKNKTGSGLGQPTSVLVMPGTESFRRDRVDQTTHDKTLFTLSQLCSALTFRKELHAFEEVFDPRTVLQTELQMRLFEYLRPIVNTYPTGPADKSDVETRRLVRPSDMLRRAQAVMEVLIDLEDLVCIDVVAVFSSVFEQHTHPSSDTSKNVSTLTTHYSEWYADDFIQQAYLGHFVYSPLLMTFVTMPSPDSPRFRAEEYSDLNELRALAELIGPVGMKYLHSRIMDQIGSRVDEVKKLVILNRPLLEELRGAFDDPVKTRKLAAQLLRVDMLLSYLREIGIGLAFLSLCREALGDVTQLRAPFLVETAKNIRIHMRRQGKGKLIPSAIFETEVEEGGESGTNMGTGSGGGAEHVVRLLEAQLLTSGLCASMGISCDGLDAGLCELLRLTQRSSTSWNGGAGSTAPTAEPPLNLQYHIACLFIVFVANALPQLARVSGCAYRVNLAANEGNTHCIAYAVTTLMVCMFSVLSPGDLEERSTEFLALASSNLLRLGLETSSSLVSAAEISGAGDNIASSRHTNNPNCVSSENRDSVYLLFDEIVRLSPVLTANLQEACFPCALIRSAYNHLANTNSRLQHQHASSKSNTGLAHHHHHHNPEVSQYHP
ncbi:Nck-associated protein 1 [Taenia crassiceps]|uniref:Nck-associated protein 1 n=1 Tax=Taenia crassiceps TaxID=6207 RepID=A0ABR4QP29_9CEST